MTAPASPKAKRRARQAKYVAAWKAAGLCPHCGREPAPGRVSCERCLARDRVLKLKAYHRQAPHRLALGLCLKCGVEAIHGQVYCGRCAEMSCESQARRVAKRRAAGMCLQCLTTKPEPGRTRCRKCLDYQKEFQRRHRAGVRLAVDRRRKARAA